MQKQHQSIQWNEKQPSTVQCRFCGDQQGRQDFQTHRCMTVCYLAGWRNCKFGGYCSRTGMPENLNWIQTVEQKKDINQDWLHSVTAKYLNRFGIMMEFLGHIGTILAIPHLDAEDYRCLLNAESSSLQSKYDSYLQSMYSVHRWHMR